MSGFVKTMCPNCAEKFRLEYDVYKQTDSQQQGQCCFCGRHMYLSKYKCFSKHRATIRSRPPQQRYRAGGGERAKASKL